jgi:UDPglucose 6-dehydrogenase
VFLSGLGRELNVPTPLLASVKTSNDGHRGWAARRLDQLLGGVAGKCVAVWGLTYKPGTDTLRRSSAIELCEWLLAQGAAAVRAHDPAVKALPGELERRVVLAESPAAATDGASALVVATPWPDYRAVAASTVLAHMRRPLVLDANRFLASTLGAVPGVEYVSVGKAGA